MIPKVIHYCWFGGKPLPTDVKECIRSWKKHCPDYEIKRWDESNFDVSCHPFIAAAYEAKAWAFVSDYARLKIIYENGGVYFDTDVELLKNIDFLLEEKCYISVQQEVHLCTTGLGFGAVKGSPVVKAMLEQYDGLIFSPEKTAQMACPYLNDAVLKNLGYQHSDEIVRLPEVTVYPSRFFDPLAPGKTQVLLCEDTVSIHHYSATWTSGKNRLKRRVYRAIGEERIHRFKKLLGRAE